MSPQNGSVPNGFETTLWEPQKSCGCRIKPAHGAGLRPTGCSMRNMFLSLAFLSHGEVCSRAALMANDKLTTYKAKRDFRPTREPSGHEVVKPSTRRRFVIQKHDATRAAWQGEAGSLINRRPRSSVTSKPAALSCSRGGPWSVAQPARTSREFERGDQASNLSLVPLAYARGRNSFKFKRTVRCEECGCVSERAFFARVLTEIASNAYNGPFTAA